VRIATDGDATPVAHPDVTGDGKTDAGGGEGRARAADGDGFDEMAPVDVVVVLLVDIDRHATFVAAAHLVGESRLHRCANAVTAEAAVDAAMESGAKANEENEEKGMTNQRVVDPRVTMSITP